MFDIRKFNRLPSWLVKQVEQMVDYFGLPAKVFVKAAWRSNVEFFRPYQNIWLSLDDLDRAANYGYSSRSEDDRKKGWEGIARAVATLVALALYYHRHGHAPSPQDAIGLWRILQEVCSTPAYGNLLQGEGVSAERALVDALCPLPGGQSAIVADMSYLPAEIAQSLGMTFEEEDGTEFEVIGFNKHTWMLLCLREGILTERAPIMIWEKLGRPWYGD